MDEVATRAAERLPAAIDDLFDLLAQPSVSTTGEGIDDCVELIEALCNRYGFAETHRLETAGHPSLLAIAPASVPDAPTVLWYGHYDVQPADPAAWTSPPFEPTIRPGPDGRDRIFARGAGDNKGQWFAHLVAVEAYRATGGLPVNVALLLEGEEESGSPHLADALERADDRIDPEVVIVADGPIDPSGRPQVILGVRGIVTVALTARGASSDLHSGNFGGIAPHPVWALVHLLDGLSDDDGRMAIEGTHRDVRSITPADREALATVPFDVEAIREALGVTALAPGPGASPLEGVTFHPIVNINGIAGGHTGDGMKTIIPREAEASIDIRLVADQDPDEVVAAVEAHLRSGVPPGITLEIDRGATMAPYRLSLDHPVVEPIAAGVEEAWETAPVIRPAIGGSLPSADLATAFEAPCVSVPYANHDEHNHAPDENLAVWCLERGVRTSVELLSRFGAQ